VRRQRYQLVGSCIRFIISWITVCKALLEHYFPEAWKWTEISLNCTQGGSLVSVLCHLQRSRRDPCYLAVIQLPSAVRVWWSRAWQPSARSGAGGSAGWRCWWQLGLGGRLPGPAAAATERHSLKELQMSEGFICLVPLNREECSKVQVVCRVAHFTFKKKFGIVQIMNSNADFKTAEEN